MSQADTSTAPITIFSHDSAEAAVVLVKRIVRDVVDVHDAIVQVRRKMERVELGLDAWDAAELQADYDRLMDRLRDLVGELDQLGVQLEDFEVGIVSFATVTGDGDRVLVWSIEQPKSLHLLKPDELNELHKVYKRRAKGCADA